MKDTPGNLGQLSLKEGTVGISSGDLPGLLGAGLNREGVGLPAVHSRGCRRVRPPTIRSCWKLRAQQALRGTTPRMAGVCAVGLDGQGSLAGIQLSGRASFSSMCAKTCKSQYNSTAGTP